MDISVIKPTYTNSEVGISLGEAIAEPMLEFMNLRCPYCLQWFEKSHEILEDAVAQGHIRRVIKLFDKEKPSLQRGNVMHRFVPREDATAALAAIEKIFATQAQWGDLSLEEVATFAKETLGLVEQAPTADTTAIILEAEQANIKFVPTVLFKDEIFDENIELQTLASYLV